MPKLSPRLGYYIVSLGTVIQFLGLSSDSWLANSSGSSSSAGVLSFTHPGDVMLVIGMAITVLGVILGFYSLADTLPNEPARSPRLLPALPLVLLVGLSIGSVAFAYQAGSNNSNAVGVASAAPDGITPFVVATPGPETCPEGTVWHPVMGHCMTPEAIAALQNAKCPEGYALDPGTLTCLPSSAGTTTGLGSPTTTSSSTTPVCPIGYFWHPAMDHCMYGDPSTSTSPPLVVGDPTSCPAGTVWHAAMNGCMPTVCPTGFQFDYTYFTCVQVSPPTMTATPIPTGTPVSTATPTPTGTPPPSCPDGYFWHPDMGHCMSNTCPPGLVFDAVTLYCVLPSATPPPTPTATTPPGDQPSCPDGYFWHPAMGHCMSNTCPPGLVLDLVTLYCVLPDSDTTPTPTPTATPPPADQPSCPDGFFWHPAMGHCMSNTCPPGLVLDLETLYCVLPDS